MTLLLLSLQPSLVLFPVCITPPQMPVRGEERKGGEFSLYGFVCIVWFYVVFYHSHFFL